MSSFKAAIVIIFVMQITLVQVVETPRGQQIALSVTMILSIIGILLTLGTG